MDKNTNGNKTDQNILGVLETILEESDAVSMGGAAFMDTAVDDVDGADDTAHGAGARDRSSSDRGFHGTPAAKLALHALAGIAVDITIGYPNGVDGGMVDMSTLDRRALSVFRSAEPYLTATRGENFKGFHGSFHSQFKDEYIDGVFKKLKALQNAEASLAAHTEKGTEPPAALLEKLESLKLTPQEIVDAKLMREEGIKQAMVKTLQCENAYFQDIMDLMHMVLTSSEGSPNNKDHCYEADAADAFIAKLRSNPVLLARSLALDATSYTEKAQEAREAGHKCRPRGMGH